MMPGLSAPAIPSKTLLTSYGEAWSSRPSRSSAQSTRPGSARWRRARRRATSTGSSEDQQQTGGVGGDVEAEDHRVGEPL